jgi:hypothetical protein
MANSLVLLTRRAKALADPLPCRREDPRLWFSDLPVDLQLAKAYCRSCPIRSSCLAGAGDNDPARFWRHTVAALDRARPGIGERLAPLLGPPAPASFQGLVTALVNDLAGEEAVLILDDYQVIGSRS